MARYDYVKAATETTINFLRIHQADVAEGYGDHGAGSWWARFFDRGYSSSDHDGIVSSLVDSIYQDAGTAESEEEMILESLTLCLDMADWFTVCSTLAIPCVRPAGL